MKVLSVHNIILKYEELLLSTQEELFMLGTDMSSKTFDWSDEINQVVTKSLVTTFWS